MSRDGETYLRSLADRAETWLRLMAEAELRQALKAPKLRVPLWRRLRRSLPQFLRRRWRAGIRMYRAHRAYSPQGFLLYAHGQHHSGPQSPGAGLRRLMLAAESLTATAATEPEVADAIVRGHELALILRRRMPRAPFGLGWVTRQRAAPSRPKPGTYTAISLGAHVPVTVRGQPAEVSLLVLVTDPDRAVITAVARLPAAAGPEADDEDGYEDVMAEFLSGVTVTDDRLGRYQVEYATGEINDEQWSGWLELVPALRPGCRWLDLVFSPGTAPVRISLEPRRPPPVVTVEELPAQDGAARFLDIVADDLLRDRSPSEADLALIVTALTETGVTELEDPALRGLAALASRLGLTLPATIRSVELPELPERWREVLDSAGTVDGPAGLVPVAAVLPQVDEARWALAGLRSGGESARLFLRGWNVTIDDHRRHLIGRHSASVPPGYSFWARDDAGRWHYASGFDGDWQEREGNFELVVTPPLHPEATRLDLIITAKSARITVEIPLDWQETAS